MAREAASVDVADDMTKLKQDIVQLRDDLSAISKQMAKVGQASLAQARATGADKVDELRAELERTYQRLRDQGEAGMAEVERTVQERPLVSLLAAFGLGMILTKLFERR